MSTTITLLSSESRRDEAWANGMGSTAVVMREPDNVDWSARISIARVGQEGPFSDLPATRRLLVPLDAAMELHFAGGRTLRAERFDVLRFDGSPAPRGMLPDGPTRDFNLMLRNDARGELFARTLVDSMILPPEPGARWLVYLNSGQATIGADGTNSTLHPDDAALLAFADTRATRVAIEGGGEMVLARLYA